MACLASTMYKNLLAEEEEKKQENDLAFVRSLVEISSVFRSSPTSVSVSLLLQPACTHGIKYIRSQFRMLPLCIKSELLRPSIKYTSTRRGRERI